MMHYQVDGKGVMIDKTIMTSRSYDHNYGRAHKISAVWLNGSRAEAFAHVTRDRNTNHKAALELDPCVVVFKIRRDHPIVLNFQYHPSGKTLPNAWICPVDIPLEYCMSGYETIDL